jgi:hypothetical protein
MFDVDKYLDELNIKDIDPPVDLVERTMQKRKGGFRVMKKKFAFALGATAVLLFGIIIGASVFGGASVDEPIITGYYTVDINPSICLGVDAEDKVAKVTSQNEDADVLLADLDFEGDDIQAAILEIVNAAKAAGYLADDEKYVLIGYFSKDGFFASALQADLEKSLGDMIHLLLVSGTLENKTQADELGVSAGLLALSKKTEGVSITKSDGIKDVIAKCEAIENPITEEPDDSGTPTDNGNGTADPYIATTIKGSIAGTVVNLSWNKIDRSNLDGYKVMYSFTDSTPVYGDGHDGCRYYTWITNASTTSVKISDVTTLYGYAPGKTCYFSVTALYDEHAVKKAGNAVGLLMPNTPAPTLDSATISGGLTGSMVNLNWTVVSSTGFTYNKVVYSFTDSTPVYGEPGCDYWTYFTDPNDTSLAFDITLDANLTKLKGNGYKQGPDKPVTSPLLPSTVVLSPRGIRFPSCFHMMAHYKLAKHPV